MVKFLSSEKCSGLIYKTKTYRGANLLHQYNKICEDHFESSGISTNDYDICNLLRK